MAELCIKLVDEATIAELNEQWMEKEGPTDVLAFPMDELRPGLVNEEPEEGVLGDLVLCPAVAARQADGRRPLARATRCDLLTVHGILHLLGYDHAEPEEHAEMFGLQADAADRSGRTCRGAEHERRRHLAARRGSRLRRWSPACSAAPTPRSRRSPRPAPRRSRPRARAGAARLLVIVEDPPRYLNTALFLRMLTEIAAIVLVTVVMLDLIVPRGGSESGPETDGGRWWAMLASLAIMLVVSFVVIGVAPAHPRPPALRAGRAAVRGPADRLHQGARPAARGC